LSTCDEAELAMLATLLVPFENLHPLLAAMIGDAARA
jgi:hypothetical protein